MEDDMIDATTEHLCGGTPAAIDKSSPLIKDIKEFETWMKETWIVTKWVYEDWRETPKPIYDFEIQWGKEFGWEQNKISGFIAEETQTLHFLWHISEYFIMEFIKKYLEKYPDQKDNICFYDEYGEISRYYDDLSDEELLARIRTEYLDYDLMKKVWGDDWEPSEANKFAWGGDREPPRPSPKSSE
jgi:hypothetical protein